MKHKAIWLKRLKKKNAQLRDYIKHEIKWRKI